MSDDTEIPLKLTGALEADFDAALKFLCEHYGLPEAAFVALYKQDSDLSTIIDLAVAVYSCDMGAREDFNPIAGDLRPTYSSSVVPFPDRFGGNTASNLGVGNVVSTLPHVRVPSTFSDNQDCDNPASNIEFYIEQMRALRDAVQASAHEIYNTFDAQLSGLLAQVHPFLGEELEGEEWYHSYKDHFATISGLPANTDQVAVYIQTTRDRIARVLELLEEKRAQLQPPSKVAYLAIVNKPGNEP